MARFASVNMGNAVDLRQGDESTAACYVSFERLPAMLKKLKKYILIIAGSLSVALGVLGVFLPVLPTTPFLLLAFYCYIRSSVRLYNWLIGHRIFGAYIYNYVTYRAVLRSTKIWAIIFLWASLIVSMIIMQSWHIKAVLFVVGIGVSIHILTLKTLEKSKLRQYKDEKETEEI